MKARKRNCTRDNGNRTWQKIRIDVKPMLPRSDWLHKIQSTYGTPRPQGWQVHYTRAPAEASSLCRFHVQRCIINRLDSKGNYSATANNTKLVHWPLMGGLLHLVQLGGAWAGCGLAQDPHRCTKCNSPPINGQCTNHCIAIMAHCCAVLMWRSKRQVCNVYSPRK